MSEFLGNSNRVRCIDCVSLTGKHCSKKNIKVSLRKRRICNVYDFKGEYINRISPEAMRVPYTDKKTRRLLRKVLNSDIVPVVESSDGIYKPAFGTQGTDKALVMPRSTATAKVLTTKEKQRVEQAEILEKPVFKVPQSTADTDSLKI